MTLLDSINIFIRTKKRFIFKILSKRRLKQKEFTIISNNCWGHEVYNFFDLKYLTPFVGLYLYAPCYIKLLENFNYYMNLELSFTKSSKYELKNNETLHPIGILDDIEIHFLHYENEIIAKEKWERRKKRIINNVDQLFFKFDDQDKCTEELLVKFHNLDFKKKISFSRKKINYPNNFKLSEQIEYVSFSSTRNNFDMVNWLNKNNLKKTFTYKLLKFLDN